MRIYLLLLSASMALASCRTTTAPESSLLMRDGEIQTAAFGKIFCRADADVRRILTLEPGERGFTLAAKADDYGSGSSAREQTIAQRHALTLVLQPSTTTGQPYAYATATNVGIVYHFDRPSGLDPSRIDGDAEALFSASFRHGLRRSYHGDYTCIRNGYLALTVTGQEIDGDYSISVNPGDAPQPEPAHPQYFCRNNDEKTKILKAIPAAEGRYNLIAAEDQYEDESRTPEVTIARRLGLSHAEVTHEGETLERLQANGVLMWLYPNRSSVLDPVYLDGDISAVFHASFQVGLRRSHHGEYTCVKDGYLALTINGNVPGDFPDFIAANDGFVFHLLKEEEPGTEPVFACIIKQDTPYVATYIQKGECLTSRDQSRLLGYAYTEKRPNTEQTYTCTKGFPGGFSFITTTKEDPECPEGTELGARVGFQGRGSSPIGWVPVAQYLPPKPQTRSIYAADSELGFEHRTVNNGDRVARLIDQPIPGTIKLTQCVYSQKFGMGNNRTATYNTVDVGVGCAAQSTTRVLGYAYMEEQPNTEPVYRCFDRKLGNRFDAWKIGTPSLNPGCNGVVVGYVPKP